jgi:acetyl-CoA carboxylase biotin carboxyl carrier protein
MSKTQDSDIAFIRQLAELLRETDLSEIEVEREFGDNDQLKVRVTRHSAPPAPAPVQMVQAHAPAASAPKAAAPAAPEDPALHPGAVSSPMVGTCYLSAEPEAAAFVKVGDQIAEGQTLLIIEAMKTMNQIPAPVAGVVKRILVDDGAPVEFGAPLMIIE